MKEELYSTSWHLHIKGQVQGVGYRPLVYLVAQRHKLFGWVKNDTDGVHIEVTATQDEVNNFVNEITVESPPPLARITSVEKREISKMDFHKFEIVHDSHSSIPNLIITPDFAICKECGDELLESKERRHSYFFNSCSQCGPRYSIIHNLPYDRGNTKMNAFDMCPACSAEYHNPTDRRYYAQTNSCANCTIQLALFDSSQNLISNNSHDIVDDVIRSWKGGKILAIKGIGGYLVTCDASNPTAVQRLRRLKHRPSKPLAVMYPNLADLGHFDISKEAKNALTDHISPIVLIPLSQEQDVPDGICDLQDHIGIMIPYAPIFKVLLEKFKRPIVATSGNISNAPIVYRDENVFEQLSEITDYILTNNREIVVQQDDSVIKFTELHKRRIILRRSRGLAPTYINSNLNWSGRSIISTGAHLKSTFSLLHNRNVYISQYLGDLDDYDTKVNYELTLQHFINLLAIKTEIILSDNHKEYESSRLGLSCSNKWNIPIHYVQHHLAHFSAIIGEHNLMESQDRILGVIWDGTGLGTDGCMWGSEFFVYNQHDFNRCAHLSYFDIILGDKMAKEPRLSALSLSLSDKVGEEMIRQKFTDTEWRIYSQLLQKGGLLQTTSMGRLFDAVACVLGILDKQSYEGEAAMLMEVTARRHMKEHKTDPVKESYKLGSDIHQFSPKELLIQIGSDINNGLSKGFIALKFHYTLVKWIEAIAHVQECNKIAFSGGVFQNSLLVDLLITQLKKDHQLYFHEQLSPNDENISFGQLIYHQIENEKAKNA